MTRADRCATLPLSLRDTHRLCGRKLELTETQHNTAASCEERRRLQVTYLVSTDLRAPEVEVGGRHGEVLGASVPVAAVDEYGNSRSLNEQIRRPAQARLRNSTHSVAQPRPVHETAHGQLGLGIAPAVALHGLAGGLTGDHDSYDFTIRRSLKQQADGREGQKALAERG